MYSVVLMMALSGGPEAVDFGGRRCGGCNGGCHGAVATCNGGGHGCHRSHGCHGGGLFSRHGRCNGCNGGGCHAVSHGCSSSCNGGGHGCHRSSCNGCHGGGLFSRHRNRCHGCNGGCNGGCHGGAVCAGSACTGGGVIIEEKKAMPKEKKGQEEVSAPATIVVTLPADAELTFDGNATTSTSTRRVFTTPAIETGADYTYTLRARVGEATQSRNVTVRGGATTNVSFTFEAQGVASR